MDAVRHHLGAGDCRTGDEPHLDQLPPGGDLHRLYRHGVGGGVRALPPVAGHRPPGDCLAAGGRCAVHCGRRTLRSQVAGTGQPPLRLSRDLPCVYPSGQYLPLCADVCGGPAHGLSQKLPCLRR